MDPRTMPLPKPFDPTDFDALVEEGRRIIRRGTKPKVEALLAAGWTFVLPDLPDPEAYQWRWRRPGKRPGRPGRLFASTGQAFNALMREREE